MNKWFVLKTKPGREDTVTTLISKAGFELFNPKIRSVFYRSNLAHFKTVPLFPSYVFLHIDFDNPHLIHLIKYTRGVSKILCSDGKPHAIQDELIEGIRSRTHQNGIVEYSGVLKEGDRIKVKKGLLKDLEGILQKPTKPDERVIVLLKLINYDMKASLHWTEVEKIKVA